MNWTRNFGLPTKLTLVFVFAVYFPLLIVGFFSLDFAKETEKNFGLKLYDFIADMDIENLNGQLDRLKNEITILSKINHIQEILKLHEENPKLNFDQLMKNRDYQKYLSEFEERLKLILVSNPNLFGIGFFVGQEAIVALEENQETREVTIKRKISLSSDLPKHYVESITDQTEGIWHYTDSFIFPFNKIAVNIFDSSIGLVGVSPSSKKTPFLITFYYNPWLHIKKISEKDITELNNPFSLILKEEKNGKVTDYNPKSEHSKLIEEFLKKLPQAFLNRDAAEHVDENLNIYSIRKVHLSFKNLEKISLLSFYPARIIRAPLKDTRNLIIKILVTCFLIVIPFLYLALRIIISRLHLVATDLKKTSDTLESSTNEILTTSENIKKSNFNNQKSVNSVSSSMDQLAISSLRSKEKIKEMNSIFKETSESAIEGRNDIKELALSMDQIVESSKSIFKIINIIENISMQTNILSMNASVEAARAGEHGKGFAVVAEAIRNLAQKSSKAAGDIGKLIQDSIDKSQNGSLKASRNLTKFKEIIENIEASSRIVEENTKTLDNRLEEFGKLAVELKNINNSVNEGSSQTEKHREIALRLSEEAESLKKSINQILEMVEGQKP